MIIDVRDEDYIEGYTFDSCSCNIPSQKNLDKKHLHLIDKLINDYNNGLERTA